LKVKLAAIGIEEIHCHKFRNNWVRYALKAGAGRRLVQDAMGWESLQMLKRYAGSVSAEMAAAPMPKWAPV
jgi:integrase